jgi:hypothetical protein
MDSNAYENKRPANVVLTETIEVENRDDGVVAETSRMIGSDHANYAIAASRRR